MNVNWLPHWRTPPPITNVENELLANEIHDSRPQAESQLLDNSKVDTTDGKTDRGIERVDSKVDRNTERVDSKTSTNAEKIERKTESIGKSAYEQTQPRRKVVFSKVKHKSSTTSLASMSAGNWLRWAPKNLYLSSGDQGGSSDGIGDVNGNDYDDDEEAIEEGNDGNETATNDEDGVDNDDDDDYSPQDNGDEIDDHISGAQNRKKLWSFWSDESSNKKDKLHEKVPGITNTILKSSPSLQSREDTWNAGDLKSGEEIANTKLEAESADSDNGGDDAVLYKPHDSASQFSKINTHKNENLRENVIVPDWNTCLQNQKLDSTLSTSQSTGVLGVGSRNQTFDIKNWRNYLSHLSSRFGFGSTLQSSGSETGQSAESAVEKEFHSLYERSYHLYGRALTKLPYHKRACLPIFSLFYTKTSTGNPLKRQKTQIEEDAEDENNISITNDAMGNLLINQHNLKSTNPSVTQSDRVNQKLGPLKKIKKILIVGVHGFFPTRMIRPIIGAPKGTSSKFANEAEKAVIRYCLENNLIDERETHNASIQKIALEKEGKIFNRVDFFLEIMTKWADELNDADFIFIAAHSQGCVVSIILFARLIQMGILKNPLQKRIGLLGMAGVNNGPFYGIDKSFFMKAYSAIEHDSLMELFELTKFDSEQSLAYKEAMQIIVDANVKICFIGSINDQVVPLYSALASHIFHPNIYRACYIDHSSRTPDFIKRLVSACCQLQNLGYFDNNVIKELSAVLAGPLTGSGHSKIYNDGKVYDLGLKFALDTDDLVIPGVSITQMPAEISQNGNDDGVVQIPPTNQVHIKEYNTGKIGTNPFVLPWCLRGLIFNIEKNWPKVQPHTMIEQNAPIYKSGSEEIDGLYELFDKWQPDSKLLRELKFRLNGIRASKL